MLKLDSYLTLLNIHFFMNGITMRALLFILQLYFSAVCFCADFDSYEMNQLEVTPIYDIILFNDIADVIKDFDNDVNTPDVKSLTESESNEKIEDLLLEYQHYLEKAHKQHVKYLEKVTGKNKVPLLRHDKYPKRNGFKNNFDDFYQFPTKTQKTFSNLQSLSHGFKGDMDLSYTTSRSISAKLLDPPFDRFSLSSNIQRNNGLSSCYCKSYEIPCNCGCKQCFIQFDAINSSFDTKSPRQYDEMNSYKDPFIRHEGKINNDFKIRIKVDIKLPKIIERIASFLNNKYSSSESEATSRKEYSMNYITPYLNLPNAIDRFNFNSVPRLPESIPLQRITIHKKKKYRSNSNKKHKKKTINIHENETVKNTTITRNTNETVTQLKNETINMKNPTLYNNTNFTTETSNYTALNKSLAFATIPSKEFIYLTLNISNENDNHTIETNKLENSIETGYFKTKDNFTAIILNREKRASPINSTMSESLDLSVKPLTAVNETHEKKFDKLLNDSTLSYWPESIEGLQLNTTKNINFLIVDIEKKKSKFNMSRDTVRNNHSMAIERAIFGEIDWNDVDTVAPAFISFVGKYIHGILTFCSHSICHSMKCIDKTCIHRTCNPDNRYNKIGHCLGNSSKESVVKLESLMDLPSNVALEIVDILQDKMLGKLYGKITICIGFKCVTFVASKKTLVKYKCTSKEITSSECPYKKQR